MGRFAAAHRPSVKILYRTTQQPESGFRPAHVIKVELQEEGKKTRGNEGLTACCASFARKVRTADGNTINEAGRRIMPSFRITSHPPCGLLQLLKGCHMLRDRSGAIITNFSRECKCSMHFSCHRMPIVQVASFAQCFKNKTKQSKGDPSLRHI